MRILSTTSIFGTSSNSTNIRTADNNKQHSKNCDILTISKSAKNAFNNQSKKGNMLDSLLKQKQDIMESKNNLIERTLDQEQSLTTIKDQLADYDDQINVIDKQISDYMLQEKQKALGNDEKDEKEEAADNDKSKTRQEIQNEKLNCIVSLNSDIPDIQNSISIKEKLEGQTKVLKREIKADEARSLSGLQATAKRKELASINDSIDNITKMVSDKLTETEQKIEDTFGNESTKSSDKAEKTSAMLEDRQNN